MGKAVDLFFRLLELLPDLHQRADAIQRVSS